MPTKMVLSARDSVLEIVRSAGTKASHELQVAERKTNNVGIEFDPPTITLLPSKEIASNGGAAEPTSGPAFVARAPLGERRRLRRPICLASAKKEMLNTIVKHQRQITDTVIKSDNVHHPE